MIYILTIAGVNILWCFLYVMERNDRRELEDELERSEYLQRVATEQVRQLKETQRLSVRKRGL